MQVAVISVSCSCKISNFVLFLQVKAKAEQVKTEGMNGVWVITTMGANSLVVVE